MRMLLLTGLLLSSLCQAAGPDTQARVELYAPAGQQLSASRLDGQRLNDGRLFRPDAGAHELLLRHRFEVPRGGSRFGEPKHLTCQLRLRYDSFQPGQRYLLEARAVQQRSRLWLRDAEGRVLARGQVLRCGPL